MGANVVVIEVDPIRALSAAMEGYQVMTAAEAAPIGDVFLTATGDIHIFRPEHFKVMKDGAILGERRALRRGARSRGPRRDGGGERQ